jgi:hypothetical protein
VFDSTPAELQKFMARFKKASACFHLAEKAPICTDTAMRIVILRGTEVVLTCMGCAALMEAGRSNEIEIVELTRLDLVEVSEQCN